MKITGYMQFDLFHIGIKIFGKLQNPHWGFLPPPPPPPPPPHPSFFSIAWYPELPLANGALLWGIPALKMSIFLIFCDFLGICWIQNVIPLSYEIMHTPPPPNIYTHFFTAHKTGKVEAPILGTNKIVRAILESLKLHILSISNTDFLFQNTANRYNIG